MSIVIASPHEDLAALLVRMDRLFPKLDEILNKTLVVVGGFSIHNTVIEAKAIGMWRLESPLVPPCPDVPTVHQKPVSRRWFIRKHTARATRILTESKHAADGWIRLSEELCMPPDLRLWYPSDSIYKLLLLGKHDLDMLFKEQMANPTLPCENDEKNGITLFATPGAIRDSILYRDSIEIINQHTPYLARLCKEYVCMMCWLYGLTTDEFGDTAHMYITRHCSTHGKPVALDETTDCGRYSGGPLLTTSIGWKSFYHDFLPILATSPSEPVRVKIGEGVLVVLDGCAKSMYSHGHPAIPEQKYQYYTLNFKLDCLRRTICMGVEKETRGLITYTPFIPEHVVTTRPDTTPSVAIRMDSCSIRAPLLEMRTRLKLVESHLLTQAHKTADDITGQAGLVQNRHRQASWPNSRPR